MKKNQNMKLKNSHSVIQINKNQGKTVLTELKDRMKM